MDSCVYCGQRQVDGGLGSNGQFICIDCIALNPEANEELVSMKPLQSGRWADMIYPPECYDVTRFKRKREQS